VAVATSCLLQDLGPYKGQDLQLAELGNCSVPTPFAQGAAQKFCVTGIVA